MERSEFLARVRAAGASAILPTAPASDPGQWVPDLPDVDPVERFSDMARSASADVHAERPADVIADVVERYQIGSYISWDVDRIDGLDQLPNGLERIQTETPRGDEGRASHNEAYTDVRLGITGAEAAFAETGSIVVR